LEVVSSINIMRLSLDIPGTFYYVMANGFYKLVFNISDSKGGSELMLTSVTNLAKNLRQEKYTNNYIKLFFTDEPSANMTSYYNVSSSIVPVSILAALENSTIDKMNTINYEQFLPKLLRSIYNFDTYHKTKGSIKYFASKNDQTDCDKLRKNLLASILKIDFNRLPRIEDEHLFSDDSPFVEFELEISEGDIDRIFKKYGNKEILTICSLPIVNNFIRSNGEMTIGDFNKEIANIENNVCNILGINYKNYKLYAVQQFLLGLMFSSQKERVDIPTKKVLFPDLVNEEDSNKFFKKYINNIYFEEYERLVSEKHNRELQESYIILADEIMGSDSKEEVIDLFKNGLKSNVRGVDVVTKFVNQDTYGVRYLIDNLIDANMDIVDRSYKIWVTILGTDMNTADFPDKNLRVWNGDNIIKLHDFNKFLPYFSDEEWNSFRNVVQLYRSHSYRASDIPNRHGYHASNPSFYGLGYESLLEFIKRESVDEVKKYLGIWSTNKNMYRSFLENV